MERITWIDLLRGFSMMAILWFHTEVYYAGSDVIPYVLYVDNVLAVFFFISGYLFKNSKPFDPKKKNNTCLTWAGNSLFHFHYTLHCA